MSGFDPVGSKPVASISAPLVGTYFMPTPAVVVLAGTTVNANVSGIKSASLSRETLLATAGKVRSGGLSRETLLATLGKVRSAGLFREVLRSGGTGNTGDNCSVCIVWGQ